MLNFCFNTIARFDFFGVTNVLHWNLIAQDNNLPLFQLQLCSIREILESFWSPWAHNSLRWVQIRDVPQLLKCIICPQSNFFKYSDKSKKLGSTSRSLAQLEILRKLYSLAIVEDALSDRPHQIVLLVQIRHESLVVFLSYQLSREIYPWDTEASNETMNFTKNSMLAWSFLDNRFSFLNILKICGRSFFLSWFGNPTGRWK